MAAALPGALDFPALKKSFVKLMNQAEPNCLPAFILWLDLKVAQFKINGCMYADTVHEETWISYAKDVLKKINNSGGQYPLPGLPGLPFPPSIYGQMPSIPPPYEPSRADYSMTSQSSAYNGDVPLSLVMKKKKRRPAPPPAPHQLPSSLPSAPMGISEPMPSHNIYSQSTMHEGSSLPHPGHNIHSSPLPHSGFDLRVPRERTHKDSTGSASSVPQSAPESHEEFRMEEEERLRKKLSTLRTLLSEPPKTAQEADACDLSSAKPVAAKSIEGLPTNFPCPVEEVHCPSDASACDSPAHSAYDVQKQTTKDALKMVLTKKQGKHRKPKVEEGMPPTSGLDLSSANWSMANSDVESSPTKGKKDGSPKSTNVCPICYRSFDYRSSFRRHMRIHEGVYSHQCAVCGRKFTRKEHFDRHKCSRRPNKPSRSADGSVESSPEKRIKVAYPPLSAMEGLAHPPPEPVLEQESMLDDSMYFEKEERPLSRDNSAAEDSTDERGSLTGESRRKKSIPRKAVSEHDEDDVEAFYRHQSPHSDDMDFQDSPADSEVFHERSEMNSLPLEIEEHSSTDISSLALESSTTMLPNKAEVPDRLREYVELSPTHSLSEDDSLSDPGTPTRMDEFTLDTGSYKVSAEEPLPHDAIETNSRGRFIKVTKQGKYLKLKREVQLIDGHLCFVCPNCSKVFHRSSNFSRHMRIHRGVYSYLCPTCHRGFFRKEHFQKHKCHRKSMSHIWDRKTKLDTVLKPKMEHDDEMHRYEEQDEGEGCLYIDENAAAEV